MKELLLLIRVSSGFLLLTGLLTGCTSQSGPQLPEADFFVNSGQTFGLRVGETAGVVTSAAIDLVRFNGVTQDSRCPEGVACVIAGSATVLLTVQTALSVHDISLEVPPDGEVEQEVDELTVRAVGVRPNAAEGVTIDPLNYVVGLVVTQTGSLPTPS